jgi:hypothetical protein
MFTSYHRDKRKLLIPQTVRLRHPVIYSSQICLNPRTEQSVPRGCYSPHQQQRFFHVTTNQISSVLGVKTHDLTFVVRQGDDHRDLFRGDASKNHLHVI